MSLPDHFLEEPDSCETHGHLLPCWQCRMDAADEQAEWQFEREALELCTEAV